MVVEALTLTDLDIKRVAGISLRPHRDIESTPLDCIAQGLRTRASLTSYKNTRLRILICSMFSRGRILRPLRRLTARSQAPSIKSFPHLRSPPRANLNTLP